MRFAWAGVATLLTLACETASNPTPDAGVADGAIQDGGGEDGGEDRDGSAVDDNASLTLSPAECQADLTLIREEDFEVREHPLAHKGDFFGFRDVPTADGNRLALISLVDDTVLAVAGQSLPGFVDDEELVLGPGSEVHVAPDYGRENEPDYPVVFTGNAREDALNSRGVMYRSDGRGATRFVISGDDTLQLGSVGGAVARFSRPRLGPQDDLYFLLSFEGSPQNHLVQQAWPSAPIALLLAEGAPLPTGDSGTLRFVASIGPPEPVDFGVKVRVDVADQTGAVEGFAYLRVDTFTGDTQCLATDTSILCGGLLVTNDKTLVDVGSDGATIGGVLRRTDGEIEFQYKVIGVPTVETIERNKETQGFTIGGFGQPKVCGRDNAVYFVGSMSAAGRGAHDELMRIKEDGTLEQLTQFGSLLDDEAIRGHVPDEIRDWAIGYNCDAVLYTWGPSPRGPSDNQGYEGYWAVYDQGDTVEIIDETPTRGDGNGAVRSRRARSGIDPNARPESVVNIGPEGEFYFVPYVEKPDGRFLATYAVATEPVNRCRTPNVVNSGSDAPDLAPGDGNCDTGNKVGADAECTLRAALEETNQNSGPDAIRIETSETIAVGAALPPVTSAVTIEGPGTVDGGAAGAETIGLDVRVPGVEITNLRITNFGSHGLKASHGIRLDGVESTDNCGWGLWLEAEATISGEDGSSNIQGNGAGDGCSGGGIFSRPDRDYQVTLTISDVSISDNDGPGVLARGVVRASQLQVISNQGDGISVGSEGGAIRTRLRVPYGALVARGNRGHGVSVEPGGMRTDYGHVQLDANCGFGLRTDDAAAVLGGATGSREPSVITGNGDGQAFGDGRFWRTDDNEMPVFTSGPCVGGGISVTGIVPDSFSELSRITTATISGNMGPGVATTGPFRFFSVQIEGNAGPGVFFTELETVSADTVVVSMDGQNRISANEGSGVDVRSGSISIKGRLELTDNHGAGLATENGDLFLNEVGGSGHTNIERNGVTGQCRVWREMTGAWIGESAAACTRNEGGYTASGDITANRPVIRDNGGSGLSAADPDGEGFGIVTVRFGEICNNGAPDQAETMNYTSVDDTCSN